MSDPVDKNFEDFKISLKNLVEYLDSIIRPLIGKDVAHELAQKIKAYQENKKNFEDLGTIDSSEKLETAYMYAERICIYSNSILLSPSYFKVFPEGDESKRILADLVKVVENYINNRPVLVGALHLDGDKKIENVSIKTLAEQVAELEERLNGISRGTAAAVARLADVDVSLSEMSVRVQGKFEQFSAAAEDRFSQIAGAYESNREEINNQYNDLKDGLANKEKRIDEYIGFLTRKAMSGGYMRSALKEERLANGFRTAAIVLMIVLAIYVLGTIAHMELLNLDRQTAGIRVFGAIFFSFVIAYLIRQAGVHRAQYQRHHQTALDLKAIDSYAADLPKDIKDAIKQQIAEKIFVPKEIHAATDAGGFGAQEIIAKVIDKLELPKAGK